MFILRSFSVATVMGAALIMPALAQTQPPKAATTTPTATTVAGPAGTLHKERGMWRSSALVGATVYNGSGQAIGTIDNLLVSPQGDVSDAVISVGGFLGIDSKLVELSFNHLKFERSVTPDATDSSTAVPTTTPGATTGTATDTTVATSTSRPEYSVVLPDATKAWLTKLPTFTYHQQS